ncbi:unnamed protein product [Meganyctiphanes norvegica]|uniref:Transcription factor AP-2 C-terminal domain-containing protein n=1 Tax=Meganyctiphanes norvegica TaxID=48144 RepID=A0AAV2STS4_MEGNR
MASQEEFIEEILNSPSSANEEEIVHIIKQEEMEEEPTAMLSLNMADEDNMETVIPNSQGKKELVFWVPALLSIGRENHKITVKQDEVQRRIEPPECLSQTMLLSLLRLSKAKGRDLRRTLAKNGLDKLTPKSAIISSFTKITETESTQLAEDYFYLASRHLKLKEINKEIVESRGGHQNFEPQANETKLLLLDILKEIETRDTNLTLMTHGFSPLIIRAVIDILIEIMTYKGSST